MPDSKTKYKSDVVAREDVEVSNVSDIVGPWGQWQRNIFIYFFIGAMCSCWHSLGLAFYAPNVDYWCSKPDSYQNLTDGDWAQRTVDFKCNRYENPTEKCDKWQYNQSFWKSSIVSEWDIVCNREGLASLTQSAYMAGVMVTVVVMGQLSDKIGRRPVIWAGLIIELCGGLSSAFAVSIEHFMISRFALAFGASARWGTGFVLLLETVGPQYRAVVGMAIEFGWALGYIVLPLAAYLLRDFRFIQLAVTIPEFVLLLWWCSLPESPRWQLTHGRVAEAEQTIRRAAEINGQSAQMVDTKLTKLMDKALADKELSKEYSKANLFDLCRSRILIKNTLILYISWFVNAFIYYGLSLNTNNLGGNPFVNFLLAGAVEFPAYALCIYLLKVYGRRVPLTCAMFGGGIACLLTIPFMSNTDLIWLRVTFAMIGKFCVTCSFGIIYVYSAEIYPTVVRNVGVGSSSMIGRIGSILAPFVKELGKYTHLSVPLALFGILSIMDGILILFLPETKGRDIPDTIEDVEKNFSNTSSSVVSADTSDDEVREYKTLSTSI